MRRRIISWWFVVVLSMCGAAVVQGQGQIIYVDAAAVGANDGSSWTDARTFLQDALVTASDAPKPVEIRVAQGIYKSDQGTGVTPGDRDATFQLLNGVALRGGYAGVTATDPDARDVEQSPSVLRGSGADPTPLQPLEYIVTGSYTDATAVLDGFRIVDSRTAGVQIEEGSPIVSHCTLAGNSIGIRCRTAGSPTISDCYFTDNAAGLSNHDCEIKLARCLFERNSEGISCVDGTIHVIDSTFRDNDGEVMSGSASQSFDLFRCSFVNNTVDGRSILNWYGGLTARQCSFRSNRSQTPILEGLGQGEVTLVDCEFIGNASVHSCVINVVGPALTATRCSFIGNTSDGGYMGFLAIRGGSVARLSHCLFTGNTMRQEASMVFSTGLFLHLSNCTFADNRGLYNVLDGAWDMADVTQCIVRDGPAPFQDLSPVTQEITVTYSNIEGGYEGLGNIDADPAFVGGGYWAAQDNPGVEVGPEDPNAVWVPGDYHLKSQAGHWDRETETWILDDVTSPCIDAGDPNGYLGDERFPNGGYVNMGAYGGTLEASRSYFGKPVCENQIAGDINGDCIVDQTDMDILLSHWLMEPADIFPAVALPPSN